VVFYPNIYPQRRQSETETIYLLVARTSRSIPTEHVGNLPSWLCGFDSRRPLHLVHKLAIQTQFNPLARLSLPA